MTAPLDRALFPQSLLRFLATGERIGVAPQRMIDMFLQAFRVSLARRGQLALLATRLQSGATLAAEAPLHPELFPPWLAAMLAFGQKSGRASETLDWAANELDREARATRAVQVALTYPIMMFTLALLVTTMSALWLAPQYRSILDTMHARQLGTVPFDHDWPLPALLARMFVGLEAWDTEICVLLFGWLAAILVACWPRLPGHRALQAGLRQLVPGMHRVDRLAHEALAARLFAAGLASGLPVPETLDAIAEIPGPDAHRGALRDAAARARMGAPPAEAFARAEGGPAAPFALALATALSGPSPERVLERLAGVAQDRATDELHRLPRASGPLYTLALTAFIGCLAVGQFTVILRLISLTH